MSRDRSERVAELFAEAIELPPDQRKAFVARACGADAELRAELCSLLDHAERLPTEFLGGPRGRDEPAADALPMPNRIGGYRILRRIGIGGMAVVFEAEQSTPRRIVAIKLIRPELATPALARRLEHEAAVLARLRHPGIAHIYETGFVRIAGGPCPYFVMERVDGVPIDTYVRDQRLSVRGRLELVARVCDAVQHAHQHGVIHRDLKPANILVVEPDNGHDEKARRLVAQPKVLDFGIARTLDDTVPAGTIQTCAGQIMGTLPYMSPEQLAGEPDQIDTRCDVYALGVILFELLAGRRPLVIPTALPQATRVILEAEPPRLGAIDRSLRGDIETIVGKALEKDPQQRYPSAAELGADLRRYLRDEPILARPASAFYQLRKFARRRRGLVAGVLIAAAALLIGSAAAVRSALIADQQRRAAVRASRQARRQAYRAAIAGAAAALQSYDTRAARNMLRAAPEDLRRWEWHYLWSSLDQSTRRITSDFPVRDAARYGMTRPGWTRAPGRYTQNDDRSAEAWVSYADQTVTIADVASGARRRYTIGAAIPHVRVRPYRYVAISIAGRRVTGITDDGQLALVALEAGPGPRVHVLEPTNNQAFVVFSADGRRLLHRASAIRASVWDATDGRRLATLDCGRAPITAALLDATGRRAWIGTQDGTLLAFDVDTGTRLAARQAHDGPVLAMRRAPVAAGASGPDRIDFATGSADRTIRLWDGRTLARRAVLRGHEAAVTHLWFAGSELLSVADGEGLLRAWRLDHLEPGVLRGHQGYVYGVRFSPDGRTLASAGWDGYFDQPGAVRIWDVAAERMIVAALGPDVRRLTSVAFAPDSKRVVVAGARQGRGGFVALIDARSGRQGWSVPLENGYPRVAVDRAGARLLVSTSPPGGSTGGSASLLRLADGALLATLDTDSVTSCAWRPDGQRLATGDVHGHVQIRDREGRLLHDWAAHDLLIARLAFDPAGRRLATASWDGRVRIWDLASGRQIAELADHGGEAFAIAWHPSEPRLATAGRNGLIHVWSTDDWRELMTLTGHRSYVYDLAFSPDGDTLASASGDASVRLWKAAPASAAEHHPRQPPEPTERPLAAPCPPRARSDRETIEGNRNTKPR